MIFFYQIDQSNSPWVLQITKMANQNWAIGFRQPDDRAQFQDPKYRIGNKRLASFQSAKKPNIWIENTGIEKNDDKTF